MTKITFIGAGSVVFTRELLGAIFSYESEIEIPFSQIGVTIKVSLPAFDPYALLIIE